MLQAAATVLARGIVIGDPARICMTSRELKALLAERVGKSWKTELECHKLNAEVEML